MPEHSQDRIETVRVRRAPKISVFLILGALVGVFVAMILTFAFNGTAEASPNTGMEYSQGQVFGFLVLICAPVGIALAGILALALDRRSRKHTHEVAVDHKSVHVDPEPGTNGNGPGH
ncbi:MAG: potassium transporter Trk [Microbacterium sp.]|uniref:potassium transporter Trk n=1 Tax=Microbacterium sp. TaxID=51671 RepID=UPI003F7EC625